jgi:Ca2+:H+ antiporter
MTQEHPWPMTMAVGVLAGAAIGAAVVSDWFVEALRPAMATLGLSEAFVGLIVVALAGNAVENVVGIQQAMRNRTDLAISLIQNSSLQVAIALTPVLVLASLVVSPVPMTLVLTPTLLVGMALTAVLGALVVFDGESTWLEGLMLLGLYAIIAASVWYGPALTL